jgi:hypothetical protein
MTLLSDVLSECRNNYLMTGARDARNRLNGSVSASATSLTFGYDLGGIGVGAKISIDLEDLYVWDVTPSSSTATVSRGEFGSTAAGHANNAVVLVNPIVTDSQILGDVNQELNSLSSPANGLFQMKTVDVVYNSTVDGYNLTGVTDLISVYGVRYAAYGPQVEYPWIEYGQWEHARLLDTAVFASGHAIFIRGYVDPGRKIRVWYKAPFTPLAAVTDNVLTVTGLHAEAHDLLALGAAIQETAGREIRRNFTETQGDTRRAQEVPAGANLGANRGLQQLHAFRVREEAARLNAMYPMRTR